MYNRKKREKMKKLKKIVTIILILIISMYNYSFADVGSFDRYDSGSSSWDSGSSWSSSDWGSSSSSSSWDWNDDYSVLKNINLEKIKIGHEIYIIQQIWLIQTM